MIMGIFDFFNKLDTKSNNGLNLIHNKSTKDLQYAFHMKNGKIEGLFQVFHSVSKSGNNPNYKRVNVGFVHQEYFFINGLPNGYFKEYDFKGNLCCQIDSIKTNTFNFNSNFSIDFLKSKLLFSEKYQINGFVNEYYNNGSISRERKVEENKIITSKSYYQNGQLHFDFIELKEYYENGQIKKDSKGNIKEYYENGQIKFDIISGKEYYESGALKIDNKCGAKYLKLENINPDYFNDNYTFEKFLIKDTIVSNKWIFNYYKELLIYDEKGELINIEQIVDLYDQEDYHKSHADIRKSFSDMGGHISITTYPYLETRNSEPFLINNFCFICNVKIYGEQDNLTFSESYRKHTKTHLSTFTGWHNNLYYNYGINTDSLDNVF